MTQAASVHSTPRTDSSLFRLSERELTPKDVLADLFGEELHPDPEHLAWVVIQRLRDAGFEIRPIDYPKRGGARLISSHCTEILRRGSQEE